ncbi:hypothetical protein DFJ77DRAFT_474775 [Powellomyces hirtus]|nr:hypothetical protein DFJ77DRAFT_474775 [Powellomyces hirtus]
MCAFSHSAIPVVFLWVKHNRMAATTTDLPASDASASVPPGTLDFPSSVAALNALYDPSTTTLPEHLALLSKTISEHRPPLRALTTALSITQQILHSLTTHTASPTSISSPPLPPIAVVMAFLCELAKLPYLKPTDAEEARVVAGWIVKYVNTCDGKNDAWAAGFCCRQLLACVQDTADELEVCRIVEDLFGRLGKSEAGDRDRHAAQTICIFTLADLIPHTPQALPAALNLICKSKNFSTPIQDTTADPHFPPSAFAAIAATQLLNTILTHNHWADLDGATVIRITTQLATTSLPQLLQQSDNIHTAVAAKGLLQALAIPCVFDIFVQQADPRACGHVVAKITDIVCSTKTVTYNPQLVLACRSFAARFVIFVALHTPLVHADARVARIVMTALTRQNHHPPSQSPPSLKQSTPAAAKDATIARVVATIFIKGYAHNSECDSGSRTVLLKSAWTAFMAYRQAVDEAGEAVALKL